MRHSICGMLILCILVLPGELKSHDWVEIEIGASVLLPQDSDSKGFYGDNTVLPKLGLALSPFSFFSLVGMVAMQNGKGYLGEIDEPISHREIYYFWGGRFNLKLGPKLTWRVEGGGLTVQYREKAFNMELSGSTLGYYASTGFLYRFLKPLFVTITSTYTHATGTLKDRTILFGGISAGINLGVAF